MFSEFDPFSCALEADSKLTVHTGPILGGPHGVSLCIFVVFFLSFLDFFFRHSDVRCFFLLLACDVCGLRCFRFELFHNLYFSSIVLYVVGFVVSFVCPWFVFMRVNHSDVRCLFLLLACDVCGMRCFRFELFHNLYFSSIV